MSAIFFGLRKGFHAVTQPSEPSQPLRLGKVYEQARQSLPSNVGRVSATAHLERIKLPNLDCWHGNGMAMAHEFAEETPSEQGTVATKARTNDRVEDLVMHPNTQVVRIQ